MNESKMKLWAAMICLIGIALLSIAIVHTTRAQNKSGMAPTVTTGANAVTVIAPAIRLSADASQQWVAADDEQKEIIARANAALQQSQRVKDGLLLGAGATRADLPQLTCAIDKVAAVVVCQKPAAVPK